MALTNQSILNHAAIALVGSESSVALDAVAGTEKVLFVVPAGKKFIPVMVIIRTIDEAIDECVVTFGITGGTCDEFLGDQTLTVVGAGYADEALIIQPVPNATTVAALILDAAESFGMEITTAESTGTPTCTIDVFGYLYDA